MKPWPSCFWWVSRVRIVVKQRKEEHMLVIMWFCSWARRRADIALALASFDFSLLISLLCMSFDLLHAEMGGEDGVGGIVG